MQFEDMYFMKTDESGKSKRKMLPNSKTIFNGIYLTIVIVLIWFYNISWTFELALKSGNEKLIEKLKELNGKVNLSKIMTVSYHSYRQDLIFWDFVEPNFHRKSRTFLEKKLQQFANNFPRFERRRLKNVVYSKLEKMYSISRILRKCPRFFVFYWSKPVNFCQNLLCGPPAYAHDYVTRKTQYLIKASMKLLISFRQIPESMQNIKLQVLETE